MSTENLQIVPLPKHFAQVQLGGLKEIVDHQLEDGAVVQFDAELVERIDGAAVQFLLAASKQLGKERSLPLLINVNDVVKTALHDLAVQVTYTEATTSSETD